MTDKLQDRCAEMLRRLREPANRSGLIEAEVWYRLVSDLQAFVLAEIGRAGVPDGKLDDASALVLFCASAEGCQELTEAIKQAMPGLVERDWQESS